ncbi:MAG: conjugal transfer protein TraH [Gammaproteobacteria bacterium]
MLADTPLNQEEIGLLQATRLPIYKMLNVESAFAGNKDILDLTSYADVIATDILFQYLDENLTVVHTSVASLQYPETIMAQFEQSINQARASVRGVQQSAYS